MCTHINTLLNGKGAVVAVEEKTLPSQFHLLNFSNFNLFTQLVYRNNVEKYIGKCIFEFYFHSYYVNTLFFLPVRENE